MRSFGNSKSVTGDHVVWSIIETTADMGLRIENTNSWSETIEQAILGLQNFATITSKNMDLQDSKPISIRKTNSTADIDYERDLVKILEEIVYLNDVKEQWIVRADVKIDDESYTIYPQVIDQENIVRSVEVKAITRHGLDVRVPETDSDSWYAQVILDL